MPKSEPVTAIRISACIFMKLVCVGRPGEQAIGDCYGEDSIVSESALGHKQRKVFCLPRLKLVGRSNDVASDGSQHFSGSYPETLATPTTDAKSWDRCHQPVDRDATPKR